MITRAPSLSSRPGRSATSRWQVTGTERSAAGSRRVRKTVAAPPRRESWATCPSTQTSPRRPIQSAILRATVRTGHGASGEEGDVTPSSVPSPSDGSGAARGQRAGLDRLLLELLHPVPQHPQVGIAGPGRLLVGEEVLHRAQRVAAQPAAQLGDREGVVAVDRRGAGSLGTGGLAASLGVGGGSRGAGVRCVGVGGPGVGRGTVLVRGVAPAGGGRDSGTA